MNNNLILWYKDTLYNVYFYWWFISVRKERRI
ncbi:MAG: hypothetical protein ACI93V_001055, partial [Alteromonadaceae bacterium]